MNYQDYIKYDPEKKQYTDSYGYVIDNFTSKPLPTEQRAQQGVQVNKIQLVDGVTGQHPKIVVDTLNSSFTHLLLESKGTSGAVKTNNTLVVGSGNANQLTLSTGSSITSIIPSGTDSTIDVIINPKGGDGSLKVGANYTQHVAIIGNSTAKISTRYSIGANANLTLECKGETGKIVFTNETSGGQYESLEMAPANGSTTCTAVTTQPGVYPNGDIKFVPRGLGIVDCKSGTAEWNRGIGSGQTLAAGNNKVWFDNLIHSSFTYGFVTYTDIGGSKYDTFTNASGRAIVLLVTGHIRETTTVAGRTLNLWIARTGDSTLQYGQAMLSSNGADHNDKRALNSTAIIRLANNESFSLWVNVNDTGIVIGGANELAARPILSYRLMP